MKWIVVWFLLCLIPVNLNAARIKDLASLRGARDNQLVGYGLVVGLAGSGDKGSDMTQNSVDMVLKGMGVDLKAKNVDTKNAAAVIVSAVIPPFTKAGSRLDVTVSSIGNATSLDGGTLISTSLRGPDGAVYAMAQGKIITEKRSDNAAATGQTQVTAQVMNGALLEKEVSFDFSNQKTLRYQLHHPDFTTAARMVQRINDELGGRYAAAHDAGTVEILLPYQLDGTPVDVVARLEGIDVEADRQARIVINPRTGTVVLGEHVTVAPVAVAHGNLKVEIAKPAGSSPASKEKGAEAGPRFRLLENGSTVADVVTTLNEIGASPDDMVAMVKALKASGAISAEVEVQ